MQQFLKVKKHLPFWNKVINIFYIIIFVPLIPLAFGQMTLSFSLKGLILLLMVILFMIIAIKSYQKRVPSSGYYLIAQIIIALSILLVPLVILKIINASSAMVFAAPVANTLQIILLSFGLADRINVLKKENEQKQLTIIEKERVNVKLEREKTEKLLEMNTAARKFVPQEFIHALGKESITEIGLGDYVEREVTVMFADIRDYTTLSEKMKPAEVFGFVTAYSKRIGPIIEKNNGFINQYYGDGIMAIFLHSSDDAVKASIEMQKNIKRYNQLRIAKNRQAIKIGIGLRTGPLIMGIIGFENRNDATTISDAVNTASRIEGLTKYFKTSILGSETTFEKLQKAGDFNWRYLGSVQVKGREQPTELYDFYDADPPAIFKLKQETKAVYNQAIHCYFEKKFNKAASLFQSILAIFPDDPMAQYYLAKCTILLEKGVPTDWTGVEIMLGK